MIIYGIHITEEIIQRFWSRVKIGKSSECWEWQAGFNSKKPGYDYGVFWLGKRSRLAPRLALSFHSGKFIDDPEILHNCDNCRCCNPLHLIPGTHLDNMRDMHMKGRRIAECGTKRYNAKLDDEKVREIRRLYSLHLEYHKYTYTFLAKKYGVDSTLIKNVILRKAWRHVI